ncbi:MAG: 16S rRNA (guanine(527)-N(7))-methyltransferase RsmG [Pseudomonadota bacterium]
MSLQRQLSDGLRALELCGGATPWWLDEAKQTAWLQYLALLEKWNRAYNLTAVRQMDRMVAQHLLDSLAIAPYLEGPRILDVGTGAGLPGIPLAIAFPRWQFTLVDSNGKKTRFVEAAVRELGLANVEVRQCRIEDLNAGAGFDTITSRAFSELSTMFDLSRHLLAPGGRIAAMKGPRVERELAALEGQIEDVQRFDIRVPGVEGQRFLLRFAPANEAGREAQERE